ncbi:sugar phosphate isomerase/epimerase [Paenibacillus rhizovicinus]|uniref:Sugar phosphate isomerase/epimerase n=1 Tax=Paenibacillus rhizovicinus TaxID=2704463 RepID=A0A6C0P878_9BACL|nr:TIM barrel protein [Paenibacillus rhizovicinus]QHW34616.1 sugar phosphate isomerase/epimerase [Paenibacillus rhizovicinus]
MKLNIYNALWGMPGTYADQLARAAEAGYAGVEAPAPSKEQANEFKELLDKHSLSYIAQIFTSCDHAATFASQAEYAASFNPQLIVSHSAKDSMPFAEQVDFFRGALDVERTIGIPVAHETHRSRAMFTPWGTTALLKELPDLRIAADFSHWCCVTESMLDDREEDLKLAFERAIHIHARVGFAEGPQVPHPAAPEFAYELLQFEGWWGQMLQAREQEGHAFATITPEFGPPGYMPTLPFTGQAVADLWQVNAWMATRIREKFGKE